MLKTLVAGALAVATVAVPAAAATFDAFGSFNASQGAGNFAYGYASDAYDNGNLFTATTNCFIAGSICLQQSANSDVPGVTKSTTTSVQYNGSVNVPDDRLLLHPGNDGATNGTVFVAFIAPTAGTYSYVFTANTQDNTPSGLTVGTFLNIITTGTQLYTLDAAHPTYTGSGSLFLNAGQGFGVTFNRDGVYFNDSTGFNFTISSAVPEPATWSLMIAGFGFVGIGLRRKAAHAA